MPVDVDFDAQGRIVSMRAASLTAFASKLARDAGNKADAGLRSRPGQAVLQYIRTLGVPSLIALGALLVSWVWMDALVIRLDFLGTPAFTFYDVVRTFDGRLPQDVAEILQEPPPKGIELCRYLFWAVLLAPLVPPFFKGRVIWLVQGVPFIAMLLLIAAGIVSGTIASAEMRDESGLQLTDLFSIGLGTYLSLAASAYLAHTGWRRWRSVH
jgi:hypothetical protein